MNFLSNAGLTAADATTLENDRAPGKPWEPLSDNDDDGGDHTYEIDPEL